MRFYIIIIMTEWKRQRGPTSSDVLCSNSSSPCHSRSPRSLPGSSAASVRLQMESCFFCLCCFFVFFFNWFLFTHPSLLTIGKTSAGGLMRLAGYICPTTEEVACGVTRPRPLPNSSPPPGRKSSSRDLEELQAAAGRLCGDKSSAVTLLIFIQYQKTNFIKKIN